MMYTGLFFGVIFMVFWTPFLMARGIQKLEVERLSVGETVMCLIPLFNIIRAEKMFYGKIGLCFWGIVLSIVGIVARVAAIMVNRENVILYYITLALFIIGFLVAYISNVRFVYTVIKKSNALTTGKRWLFSLLYPMGQWFIGNYLASILKNQKKIKDVFACQQ